MALDTLYKISEVELVYRTKVKASERPAISTSGDAYHILMQYWDENKIELLEQFKILLLNRASRVIGISDISTGGVAGTVVDPKIVFSTALKANASSIILAHNHPSGNLQPSKEDNAVTTKMREAGSFLDLRVLDHLIVTKDGYYSYADEGSLCMP
ncbi:DNA repair protein [Chitinophagaceae bacterium IBVUCB1]|nr:DNA repair protein [Chitinophagaceae bacterium IBVUCB1]